MWNDLKERNTVMNGPRIHQLKTNYHTLHQKGMNVVTYYNMFKAGIERDKTHDFLLRLNDEQFGALRTQILGLDPFPTLNIAFAMVSQEERHQSIVRSRDDKSKVLSFDV